MIKTIFVYQNVSLDEKSSNSNKKIVIPGEALTPARALPSGVAGAPPALGPAPTLLALALLALALVVAAAALEAEADPTARGVWVASQSPS